jgi:ArsR family transcriptional regulator, arsenate/arsenite/antimonite-responsive transcriptional repressor
MRYSACNHYMVDPVALLAALAEPTRLAALRILWDGGEHCVCELMRRLGASQSRMSRHMAILRAVGLVTDRRDAQWVRYRLSSNLSPTTRAIVAAVMATVPEPHRRAA